jgi:hypothetical protein
MANRGEWGGPKEKGGRAGNKREGERAAEIKKSRRGEEGNVERDIHGNLVSKTHGKNYLSVLKRKINNIISNGEFPGYELSKGKDPFVNLFKAQIGGGGHRDRLLSLILEDDAKDASILSRDRLRKEAFDNLIKPEKDRLSFLSGLKFYLNLVLNAGGEAGAGGGGAAGARIVQIPVPIPVNNNEKEQSEIDAEGAAVVSKKVSRAVTAAQEALQNAAKGHGGVAFNTIAAFNIQNCIQWDHVVNKIEDEDGNFEDIFTSGGPISEIPEKEKQSKLGMTREEYTSHLRTSCLARRKDYLFRGSVASSADDKVKSNQEKYLSELDEHYRNKYMKYKSKYLELKYMF